jgi:hypothetical protein
MTAAASQVAEVLQGLLGRILVRSEWTEHPVTRLFSPG